jgi:hypothetical protein
MRNTLLLTALALAACSDARGKAEAAITSADQAIAAADAGKVMPSEVQILTSAVQVARDTLAKGDAAAAQAIVADIPAKAADLAARVPAKRAELTAQLDTLGFAMQKNLAAIQAKVDEIDRTRRRPAGLTAAGLDSVRATLASAPGEWKQVEADVQAGELDAAYGKGTTLRLKVSAALEAVGLVAGEAAWHNLSLPPKP